MPAVQTGKRKLTIREWWQVICGLFSLAFLGGIIYVIWTVVSVFAFSENRTTEKPRRPSEIALDPAAENASKSLETSDPKPTPRPVANKPDVVLVNGATYQPIGWDAMACNDKKITAEMQDAVEHPGALSSEAFSRLATIGQCTPISPEIRLQVISSEFFTVPAGRQHVALVHSQGTEIDDMRFYIMARELRPSR